jgi:phosphoribosylformylglycinamidine cyclo-ligase
MMEKNQYAQAGVNIDAGQTAVNLMKTAVQSTYNSAVLSDVGSFGGLFDISALKSMQRPVLVASTDGVGTKTRVAAKMGQWDTIGQDLVNHCINDILVQGARPLFFMDYVASSRLEPQQIAAIVSGMAQACRDADCALLGGETAEMPGVYEPGEVDVAGTIVGVVERDAILDGTTMQAGDAILGLPSTGLHTNGYSLARHILKELDWSADHADLGGAPGAALLATHRSYLQPVQKLREAGITIRGLAHITGGGIIDNLPRILPDGVGAIIRQGTWQVPPIFTLIQKLGAVDDAEMFRVFNMGLGLLAVVPANQVERAQGVLTDDCFHVGEIVSGRGAQIA